MCAKSWKFHSSFHLETFKHFCFNFLWFFLLIFGILHPVTDIINIFSWTIVKFYFNVNKTAGSNDLRGGTDRWDHFPPKLFSFVSNFYLLFEQNFFNFIVKWKPNFLNFNNEIFFFCHFIDIFFNSRLLRVWPSTVLTFNHPNRPSNDRHHFSYCAQQ